MTSPSLTTQSAGTGKRPVPSLEWEITSRCNYSCSYCSQGAYQEAIWSDASGETIEAVLKLLTEAKEPWLVKVAGGEPFVHPRFIEICRTVTSLGHRVCTTTNLSAPIRVLDQFLEATGNSLEFVTASLHPDEVPSIDMFLLKARHMQASKPATSEFVVTTVGVERHFGVFRAVADACADAGVRFEVAPLKDGETYVEVSDPEFREFMTRHPLRNVERIKKMKLFGTMCHTGELFAHVTVEGDVFRCYNIQPRFYLGNVTKGTFAWLDGPKPCLAKACTCTVPVNRNMIEFGNVASAATSLGDAVSAIVDHGPSAVGFVGKWAARGIRTTLSRKDPDDHACSPQSEFSS